MLSLKQKEEIVFKLQKRFETAKSTVVASINGIKSNSINRLRKKARDIGVYIQVVPNSLLRKAVLKTPYSCLLETFVENSMIAFSTNRPKDAAYIFVNFSKMHESFKIKGACFENQLISLDQINILASLPNHQESIVRLILVLKTSSIGQLVNILYILSHR